MNRIYIKIGLYLLWFLEGIVVGFSAILPGISGGTLCVAFGMYRPMIETISNMRIGLGKYGRMLAFFFAGAAVGFIGLSGIAAWLLDKNTVLITCVFIGFILGTFPELWRDAGTEGRGRYACISMIIGFFGMIAMLSLFRSSFCLTVVPGIAGYLLCGLLWGLSFIVPGLSSSTLLLFFGLYQPMLEGISSFDFRVLIPMGVGMILCVWLLSRTVKNAYKKYYKIISHAVLGIVAATAVMIFPTIKLSLPNIILYLICLLGGMGISFLLTAVCNKLKDSIKEETKYYV